MANRITLLGSHDQMLRGWLTSHPQKHERAALGLFRHLARKVADQPISDRFVLVDIIPMTDGWVIESSPEHIVFDMRRLPEFYHRCEQENLHLGFIHNHPTGCKEFSKVDDANELRILKGLCGCNGDDSILISLILVDGMWRARTRRGIDRHHPVPARHISVLSDKLKLFGIQSDIDSPENLLRQEAAFGKPFNHKLQSLRVAVVGLGGTGSPLASLLARSGIGELILIDGDRLEGTNMNRVRGYAKKHIGKPKASSLKEFICSLGLSISVSAICEYLHKSPAAIDAISSADVVFGCTDDQRGRDILNQAMYYYGLVYIDVGLSGALGTAADGDPYLRDHRGRISCILPEVGSCLRCQRVVNDEWIKAEQALEDRPELRKLGRETLQNEFYIVGGNTQAPGVGPFTSASADFAIASFMDLIRPFRQLPEDLRQDNIWIDFVHLNIHSNEPQNYEECIYCKTHQLLLANERGYRLEMPQLGKY